MQNMRSMKTATTVISARVIRIFTRAEMFASSNNTDCIKSCAACRLIIAAEYVEADSGRRYSYVDSKATANDGTRFAPSRAHTSAEAADVAKLLLNKRFLPCGVRR